MGPASQINNLYALYRMYTPYTDTTLFPTFDISKLEFVKDFSLGFVVADTSNKPSWGGYYPINSPFYKDIINRVKSKGGKLTCSFGGAAGRELATVTPDVDDLYSKYKSVIDMYGFKSVDFDIEGSAILDDPANQRRAAAILKLRNTFPKLKVSLTLPVSTNGLDFFAREIVKLTPCDIVNIMAMDYGYVGKGDMGKAACDAAEATRNQTGKDIGITVMIGVNDTPHEIFDIGDAYTVKAFANRNKWVKRLSIWSIERDRGVAGELDRSSQIYQEPFEFSKIFI